MHNPSVFEPLLHYLGMLGYLDISAWGWGLNFPFCIQFTYIIPRYHPNLLIADCRPVFVLRWAGWRNWTRTALFCLLDFLPARIINLVVSKNSRIQTSVKKTKLKKKLLGLKFKSREVPQGQNALEIIQLSRHSMNDDWYCWYITTIWWIRWGLTVFSTLIKNED